MCARGAYGAVALVLASTLSRCEPMGMFNRASRAVFAVVMIGLGVIGLISGNSPAAVDGFVKAPETLSGPRGHGELGGVR
jgi:hypothetical protein